MMRPGFSPIAFALLMSLSFATVARAETTFTTNSIDTEGTLTVDGLSTLNGDVILGDADLDLLTLNATLQGASPFLFEGATADLFETAFAVTDPTADNTITFQDASGMVAFLSDIGASANLFETMNAPAGTDPVADSSTDTLNFATGTNVTITGDSGTDTLTIDLVDAFLFNTGDTATGNYDFTGAVFTGASPFVLEGATADAFETTLALTDPTADQTITFPNASGTVAVSATGPITLSALGDIGCATCVVSSGAVDNKKRLPNDHP